MKQFYFFIILFLYTLIGRTQVTSAEVGITEGQLSVSLTGAANYTVPILVPPGINGVEPQIGLIYNSQGGNGIAGFGWSISGVSGITRVASTKYHDNIIDPVDFDVYDRFALDGQRLLLKSGTYGSDGSEYETESFSNIKIKLVNIPTQHPIFKYYFKVEYPDGSKAIYGKDASSQSLSEWKITSWENSKGVTILYQYGTLDNNLIITSIKYGALSAGTPMNEIQFSYVARKRAEQSFVGGQSILQMYILSSIKIFTNSTGYRNYTLTYDATYKDYQRLIGITEQSGDNTKSYNPIVFKYGDLVNNDIVNLNPPKLDLSNIDFQTMGNVSGDFDGDGTTDMILYPKTTADAKKKYYLYKNLLSGSLNTGIVNTAVGAFEEIFPSSILRGNATSGFKYSTEQGWTILKYDVATNTGKFSVYSTSAITPIALEYEKTYTFPQLIYYSEHPLSCRQQRPSTKHIENIPKIYLSGDFNGDSLTDIVVVEKDVQYSYLAPCDENGEPLQVIETYTGTAYFIDMDKRKTSNYVFQAGGFSLDGNFKVFVSDVDGDGRSDVLVFKSGSVKVYSLDSHNVFTLLFTKTDNSIVTNSEILLGDYNGDGKADFVIPNGVNQDSWNFFISTGTNLSKINCSIDMVYSLSEVRKFYQEIGNNNDWTTSLKESTYVALDMNGDGKTDILNQQNYTVEEDASGNPVVRPYKSPQATKFRISFVKSYTGATMSFIGTVPLGIAANVNRFPIPVYANLDDGSKSASYYVISGNAVYGLYTKFPKFDILLQEITNGNGVKETITYTPLDTKSLQGQYPVYFNTNGKENYPNIDILNDPNFLVVSMLEKKSQNTYKKKIFQYYGAVGNVEGLGFQGFRATMQTNWFDDASAIISNVSKYDISRRGALVENYSALGMFYPTTILPSSYISSSVFDYNTSADALQTNKVYKLKNISSKELNGLTSVSREIATTYDSYNYPLDIKTSIKESTSVIKTDEVNITYQGLPALRYIVGRPSSKTSTATVGTGTMTEDELYFYNSDDLLSEVQRKGDATTSYIKENITYDNFGNITKKVLTAGSDSRETNFEYESTGRFLKKSIDIEGLATSFVYNADGTLKSKTDPFSQTTSYEYDSWFKRTKETDHLGFVIDFSYVKSGSGFFLAKKGSDGSVENGRFDDLSRKTIAGFKNIMGSYTYISNFYDNYDRIHKVSDPYINDNSYRLNKTEYDTYGRVFKYTEVTGKITDISYSGLTTTISDGIKNETYIKNAFGKVNSLSDSSSNVINYTYYPNGNIKEVDYGGIKTKNLQDGWGRRKQLTDPSADVIKYTYNDFGDVLTEENKNGTTTYVRNGLGKVTSKTISGNKTNSKTTYTYDPNSKLLLQSKFEDLANGSNTVVTNYKYDKDKIIKVTETTPYAIFERRFKYDGLGRIEYENATAKIGSRKSSKTVKNTYKYGFHYQILDSITNAVVWQTNSIDSRGQLLGAQSGPATLTNMYDTYGFAKQFKFDKTSPLSNILTMDYSYDTAKSNFISRTNTLFGWSESFDFDSKDRLTKFNNNQGTQETQSYDDKGRIIQNSLGTYNYNITDKPYQNSSVTLENEPAGYYNNREGIFSDSMEDKSGWGAQKSPNTNFFSYDSTKPSHSVGKNTLKLTNTTTTEQYVFSDKWIDISNSVATQYTYSAWVFSDNPQAEIFLYMKDAANTVSQVSTVNNIKGKWIPISGTFLVPASIKKLCLRLDNNGQGNIWFDDVQIRKTSNAVIAAKELEIFYNIFKSPEQIEETGVEKINFVYNDNNQRSTMFYGSLDATKTARPLRKHYSGDGTMEIKENINTNEVEFVTYIGGDGYSAPAVVKSDGNTQNYLYLQRDYQGSILAITDATGNLVEKRLFDAWGGIIKVQDGTGKALSGLTVLERGYTGHEHIQSVGLINMNGRLYDPKLRRFLQPDNNIQDPLNIQNFNRYGYVLNNPLKYTDPTGEFWNFVAMGLAAYIYGGAVTGEANPLKWNMNNVMGALSGIGSGLASSYATGRTNSYIDSYNNKQVLGASAVSQGQITNKDIVNFFGDMSDGYNNGLNDRVTEVYNFADHQATDPIYWYNTVSSYKNDFINGRSLLNASKEYQKEIFDNVVGMSVYDWSYTAGYSAPDLAVSLATPYAAEGIVRSIENVGLSVENSLRRGILKNFSLHPRIANPYFSNVGEATKGFGFNQYDAAHRASTFLRDDIIMHGSFGIKDYKTIYFNYSTGSQNFSTAANPWTRTIYHEAPGIIR